MKISQYKALVRLIPIADPTMCYPGDCSVCERLVFLLRRLRQPGVTVSYMQHGGWRGINVSTHDSFRLYGFDASDLLKHNIPDFWSDTKEEAMTQLNAGIPTG